MKKMLFYCALMLSGLIGLTNWIIATNIGSEYNAALSGVSGTDWLFIISFSVMFFCGLFCSIYELNKEGDDSK